MDFKINEKNIQNLSDDELFSLLDQTSEEVKRRNNMISPPISDIRSKTPEENVKTVLSALSSFMNRPTDG